MLLLFFVSTASASIFLVEPVEKTLSNSESIEAGQVAVGETLRVIVQKKSGLGFDWDTLGLEQPLSQGWGFKSVPSDKTLIAVITIPKTADEAIQKLSFFAESSDNAFSRETFSVFVSVRKSLLKASMDGLKQQAIVGKENSFPLLLNNESIAEHNVLVESSLPDYWFSPIEITLKPGETKSVSLVVFPHNYGVKKFNFRVSSSLNDFEKSFGSELDVFSTLGGKLSSSIYGFPFFTPSLLPQFLVNAFLAMLSK